MMCGDSLSSSLDDLLAHGLPARELQLLYPTEQQLQLPHSLPGQPLRLLPEGKTRWSSHITNVWESQGHVQKNKGTTVAASLMLVALLTCRKKLTLNFLPLLTHYDLASRSRSSNRAWARYTMHLSIPIYMPRVDAIGYIVSEIWLL